MTLAAEAGEENDWRLNGTMPSNDAEELEIELPEKVEKGEFTKPLAYDPEYGHVKLHQLIPHQWYGTRKKPSLVKTWLTPRVFWWSYKKKLRAVQKEIRQQQDDGCETSAGELTNSAFPCSPECETLRQMLMSVRHIQASHDVNDVRQPFLALVCPPRYPFSLQLMSRGTYILYRITPSNSLSKPLNRLSKKKKHRRSLFSLKKKKKEVKCSACESAPPNAVASAQGAGSLSQTIDKSQNNRIVLYIHGGGFVSGNLAGFKGYAAELAARLNCPVYFPQYRLAPEYTLDDMVDDLLDTYNYILKVVGRKSGKQDSTADEFSSSTSTSESSWEDADSSSSCEGDERQSKQSSKTGEQSGPPEIVVAGDSAGGCLSLLLLQKLHEKGLPQPHKVVLFSPVTDLTCSGESFTKFKDVDPALLSPLVKFAFAEVATISARKKTEKLKIEGVNEPELSPEEAGVEYSPLLRTQWEAQAAVSTSSVENTENSPARPFIHPPTLIFVGDDEILTDDSVRYVERFSKRIEGHKGEHPEVEPSTLTNLGPKVCSSPVKLSVKRRVFHAWQFFLNILPEAREAFEEAIEFIIASPPAISQPSAAC